MNFKIVGYLYKISNQFSTHKLHLYNITINTKVKYINFQKLLAKPDTQH
jgi:hypothetical protein